MSKEETVEVTIRVPKKLMDALEAEKWLGFNQQYFWEAAIKGMIGCYTGCMDADDLQKFYEKYTRKIDVYYIPKSWDY